MGKIQQPAAKKFSFVNIIFYIIFGVLCGVLWAYGSPIPLIPGSVQLRLFAFLAPAIGILFGPISGFFAGYLGTVVWALLSGNFIPAHTLLADGILVGLSAVIPALVLTRGKALKDVPKQHWFIFKCILWSIVGGLFMIFTTSISLSFFTGLDYWWAVLWIGIADIAPLVITPFVVMLLAPRLDKMQTIVPRT